jgi:hypothetical protein
MAFSSIQISLILSPVGNVSILCPNFNTYIDMYDLILYLDIRYLCRYYVHNNTVYLYVPTVEPACLIGNSRKRQFFPALTRFPISQ